MPGRAAGLRPSDRPARRSYHRAGRNSCSGAPRADGDRGTYIYSRAVAHADAYTRTHGHANTDANARSNANTDAGANAHADAYTHRHAGSGTYGHAWANVHANPGTAHTHH